MKAKPPDKTSHAANELLRNRTIEALRHAWPTVRLRAWQCDVFAAAVTVATLASRLALAGQLKDRPILTILTVPIMLAAYVGGLRGGLLATAISYFGASYYLMPPFHSLRIAAAVDRWNLFFLVIAGVVISALNEALHRARRHAAIATSELETRVALVKQEALQSAIFNSTGFAGIATDEKGVIQIFNVGAQRMLGYTADEAVHKLTPAEMADPREMISRAQALSAEFGTLISPGLETLIYKASRGMEYVYEPTLIRKDGSRLPAVVSVTALRDAREAIIGYLLIGTDNTARKQAEDARRMSEARIAGIVNSAMDAIISIDSAENIVLFNAAAEKMFLCTVEAALGQPIDTFIPERFRQRHRRHVEDFGTTGVTSRSMHSPNALVALRTDGEEFPIEASISQIEFAGKRIFTVILRDITQRRQAEEQVRLLNAELEQRVSQRTSQLQTANTELKASDESLFASEERYRSLVESAKEYAILMLDTQGNITTWNAGAQRIKRYRAEEIIGKHFSIFYPSEDAALGKPERELKIALDTGQYEEDGWRLRKGGARYWANVLITALRDRRGNHLGFSKIVRDLTDRKNAEEKLRESEEWLRSLVEGGKKYAIVTLDPDGNVTTWNAGAERIKGYRPDEIIGKHMSLFYTAEDVKRGKPRKELEIATETGQYEEDGWRVRKDGSLFWANVLLTVLRDSHGKHLGFSKVTRDLTDTVRAEEQARSFFTVSLEMLCIAGFDGYFKLLNPVWEQTLGFTPEELCAKPFREFVHPDDMAATNAAAQELSTGKLLNHFENRYRCKDGSYRWLAWSVAVSADMQFMYAAAADITERRRTEIEIASLNQTLLRQNLELDSTNKELESFSYSVSHDLRAPLRAIDGFSQALSEDCADAIDAEGQDNLSRIRNASQRMGHLIDDLLDLSRLNRVVMNRERVDLSKMAREVIEELRANDPARQVNCLIADGIGADGDARLLRVVLTNLFANAWKFSAKTPDSRIEFGCVREDGKDACFVRDNGAGFDMTYAGKLFGAFQRMHSMQEFPGTGIGLATVQRIVHRHGGRIRADSAVGAGATFHFSL